MDAAVLTRQERRVLERAAAGETNHEIARALLVSAETVKSHLKNLFLKLDARNRTHAIAIGFKAGLLEVDRPSVAFVAMAPVSRTLARHDWKAAFEMLLEAGVAKSAAFEFVAVARESALESGREPARDRGRA